MKAQDAVDLLRATLQVRASICKVKEDLVLFLFFFLSTLLVIPHTETCFQMAKDGNTFFTHFCP